MQILYLIVLLHFNIHRDEFILSCDKAYSPTSDLYIQNLPKSTSHTKFHFCDWILTKIKGLYL